GRHHGRPVRSRAGRGTPAGPAGGLHRSPRARGSVTAPTAPTVPAERAGTVRRDGVRLSVREWPRPGPDPGLGPGLGPSILLVHGLASTSHIFDLVMPHLAAAIRVVAYDQRGHGRISQPT